VYPFQQNTRHTDTYTETFELPTLREPLTAKIVKCKGILCRSLIQASQETENGNGILKHPWSIHITNVEVRGGE